MYHALQFLHVAAAIIWIGSGVGLVALFAVMQRSGDRATLMAASRHLEGLAPKLFGPAAMGTLIFGILTVLTSEGAHRFSDLWITIGFAGIALSLVIVGLSKKANQQIGAAVAQHGPDAPQVTAAMTRARMFNYVDIGLLLVVVWAMVAKPGT